MRRIVLPIALGICLFLAGCNLIALLPWLRDCETLTFILFDTISGDPIPNAEVTIALSNDIGDATPEEYLASFGDGYGTTTKEGSVDVTVCGRSGALDFVSGAYKPEYTLIVLGVRRSTEMAVETVVIEFQEFSRSTVAVGPTIEGISGDTVWAAVKSKDSTGKQ